MQQRLFVALALVHDPEVVFLDEVTAGLDPQARRTSWDLIEDVRDGGATVVLVTHFMEEAQRLCDRVAIIEAEVRFEPYLTSERKGPRREMGTGTFVVVVRQMPLCQMSVAFRESQRACYAKCALALAAKRRPPLAAGVSPQIKNSKSSLAAKRR